MSVKRIVRIGVITTVLLALFTIAAFLLAIWSPGVDQWGDPSTGDSRWGATGFLSFVVTAVVAYITASIHDAHEDVDDTEEAAEVDE